MFDSIRVSLTHKPNFYVNYGTRNAFFSNTRTKVRGISAGVSYNKQFTLALGYNWVLNDVTKIFNSTDTGHFKLRYITPFMEFAFVEKNNTKVSIPIYLGFGTSLFETNTKKQYEKQFVMLYEPSMKATYRFFRYFGISAGVGARMILAGNRRLKQPFISPMYTLGFKLFLEDLFLDTKKLFD